MKLTLNPSKSVDFHRALGQCLLCPHHTLLSIMFLLYLLGFKFPDSRNCAVVLICIPSA